MPQSIRELQFQWEWVWGESEQDEEGEARGGLGAVVNIERIGLLQHPS